MRLKVLGVIWSVNPRTETKMVNASFILFNFSISLTLCLLLVKYVQYFPCKIEQVYFTYECDIWKLDPFT